MKMGTNEIVVLGTASPPSLPTGSHVLVSPAVLAERKDRRWR
jgi:hypothetical protein